MQSYGSYCPDLETHIFQSGNRFTSVLHVSYIQCIKKGVESREISKSCEFALVKRVFSSLTSDWLAAQPSPIRSRAVGIPVGGQAWVLAWRSLDDRGPWTPVDYPNRPEL